MSPQSEQSGRTRDDQRHQRDHAGRPTEDAKGTAQASDLPSPGDHAPPPIYVGAGVDPDRNVLEIVRRQAVYVRTVEGGRAGVTDAHALSFIRLPKQAQQFSALGSSPELGSGGGPRWTRTTYLRINPAPT